jgi:methylenetetrahydrofolate reductase (NADPH)
MNRISIELVPHAPPVLAEELEGILKRFPNVDTINIPDLVRLPTRSWDACLTCFEQVDRAIPHLRSCDFDLQNPAKLHEIVKDQKFSEILVVGGDFFEDREHYETSAIDLIQFFKKEYPAIKIYAAIDPYRSSFEDELAYVHRKLDAGADGFFTQPYFDLQLFRKWLNALEGINVYWGLSPVLSEKSQKYWETRNLVNFPKDFVPTLEWNAQFAADLIAEIVNESTSVYFMPIRIPVIEYLDAICEKSSEFKVRLGA